MKIDKQEVLHLAQLSRLNFTEEELERIGDHLDNVIQTFKGLELVDVSAVPPTAHILDYVNVLREDVAGESTDRELLLSNAPDSDGEAYIVPQVLE